MSWKDKFPAHRYFETKNGILYCGDSRDILQSFPVNSIDTVLTDPPYGLSKHSEKMVREVLKHWLGGDESYIPRARGFMGHEWDAFVPQPALWKEVYRVMKHGATILTFAGTRTQDLMSMSLRLAGFEIKDVLMWLYGQGFPKGQDISKMMDKRLGAERKVVREVEQHDIRNNGYGTKKDTFIYKVTVPATLEAKKWEGYHTHSLKPAYEPIIMAMKPNDGSYVDNALKWGVAGLNVDEARIPTNEFLGRRNNKRDGLYKLGFERKLDGSLVDNSTGKGRYPANVILDEISAKMLDKQSGITKSTKTKSAGGFGISKNDYGDGVANYERGYGDKGGASRFFYVAKAGRKERMIDGKLINTHPTLKPIKLIEYFVKLTKMPNENQVYLDPFIGSGTTAIECELQNKKWIGIEKEEENCKIAVAILEKCCNLNVRKLGD